MKKRNGSLLLVNGDRLVVVTTDPPFDPALAGEEARKAYPDFKPVDGPLSAPITSVEVMHFWQKEVSPTPASADSPKDARSGEHITVARNAVRKLYDNPTPPPPESKVMGGPALPPSVDYTSFMKGKGR